MAHLLVHGLNTLAILPEDRWLFLTRQLLMDLPGRKSLYLDQLTAYHQDSNDKMFVATKEREKSRNKKKKKGKGVLHGGGDNRMKDQHDGKLPRSSSSSSSLMLPSFTSIPFSRRRQIYVAVMKPVLRQIEALTRETIRPYKKPQQGQRGHHQHEEEQEQEGDDQDYEAKNTTPHTRQFQAHFGRRILATLHALRYPSGLLLRSEGASRRGRSSSNSRTRRQRRQQRRDSPSSNKGDSEHDRKNKKTQRKSKKQRKQLATDDDQRVLGGGGGGGDKTDFNGDDDVVDDGYDEGNGEGDIDDGGGGVFDRHIVLISHLKSALSRWTTTSTNATARSSNNPARMEGQTRPDTSVGGGGGVGVGVVNLAKASPVLSKRWFGPRASEGMMTSVRKSMIALDGMETGTEIHRFEATVQVLATKTRPKKLTGALRNCNNQSINRSISQCCCRFNDHL
eukprot:jgi/Bigna1/127982/aug1.5_g2690